MLWTEVFEGLPESDKAQYAKMHRTMCEQAFVGDIKDAKIVATDIELWEKERWEAAKREAQNDKTT